MGKQVRENYKTVARKVAFDQSVYGNSAFGYLSPSAYDALPPLSEDRGHTVHFVFASPTEPLTTFKADIAKLAYLCEVPPVQQPHLRPNHLAWTIEVLNREKAQKLREIGKNDARAGDFHLRLRTGSFQDYAKLYYALLPDKISDTLQTSTHRVTRIAGGAEQVETGWAVAARKSLEEAKVPYVHSAESDGTQRFRIEGPRPRPALIFQGMLHNGAFEEPNSPVIYPALKPVFARLPDNFGAVTLAQVQEARRESESRRFGFLRRSPKVDSYRHV